MRMQMSGVAESSKTGFCKWPSGGVGLGFSLAAIRKLRHRCYKNKSVGARQTSGLYWAHPVSEVFCHMTWTSQGGSAVDRGSCSQAHEIWSQDVACLPCISVQTSHWGRIKYLMVLFISSSLLGYLLVFLVIMKNRGFKVSFIASVLWRLLHSLFFFFFMMWCNLKPLWSVVLKPVTKSWWVSRSLVSPVLLGQKNGGSLFATQMVRNMRYTCQLIAVKLAFPFPSV